MFKKYNNKKILIAIITIFIIVVLFTLYFFTKSETVNPPISVDKVKKETTTVLYTQKNGVYKLRLPIGWTYEESDKSYNVDGFYFIFATVSDPANVFQLKFRIVFKSSEYKDPVSVVGEENGPLDFQEPEVVEMEGVNFKFINNNFSFPKKLDESYLKIYRTIFCPDGSISCQNDKLMATLDIFVKDEIVISLWDTYYLPNIKSILESFEITKE